jgi:hypothetical protein
MQNTDKQKEYFKDYYKNKKIMVKCDRCDCEVNSFGLKQHYKSRVCLKAAQVIDPDINNKCNDNGGINSKSNDKFCILLDMQIEKMREIRKLAIEIYDLDIKLNQLDHSFLIRDRNYLTLEKYNQLKNQKEQI